MKIKIDDEEADMVAVKVLKRSLKFLIEAEGTDLEYPYDSDIIDAIEVVLKYYAQ